MRVYVSNYASYKGDYGVQISATKPKWAEVYKSIPVLYPSWDMIKNVKDVKSLSADDPRRTHAEEEYTKRYIEQLNTNKEEILRSLSEGDVMMCWCARGSFCHRYILQQWLVHNGISCREV